MAIYNFGNGVFSAVGDTRKPLVYLTIAGVLNVILDLFFVIVCKMSVAGAALATILTQYLSAFLILRALAHTEGCYGLRREKLHLDPVMTRSILGLGVPAGCQNAIFALANLFIQASINTFDTVVVSGNSAAANADPLVYDVMAAFYTACASFMSQNYGAASGSGSSGATSSRWGIPSGSGRCWGCPWCCSARRSSPCSPPSRLWPKRGCSGCW